MPDRAEPVDSAAPCASWRGGPLIAAVLAVFALLPIGSWVMGQPSSPLFGDLWREWASGTTIAIGVGVILALAARRRAVPWGAPLWRRIGHGVEQRPVAFALGVAAMAAVLAMVLAATLFNARPILIDEIAQVRQAQIFAHGLLWLPVPPHEEFVSSLFMVDAGGKVYSQFPPGGPAMLALGQLVGAPWIVNPLVSAVSVLAFAALVRQVEPDHAIGGAAIALFALAPFTVFMSASQMNHVPTLMWLLVASAALATGMADQRPRPGLALLSGVGFGAAATIRPADALAFALPAAAWYLVRAIREPARWRDAIAAAVGVAAPMVAMMVVNAATTGSPLRFGYQVLWGNWHTLGFHRAPWGEAHTPARGLEYINRYLLQLERYLFETPIPSLLPAIGALAIAPRLRSMDRYLIASGTLLLLAYFAYFHDGYYLGPRFIFPLVPVCALWTARFPALLQHRWGAHRLFVRGSNYALAVSAAMALLIGIPIRATSYAHSATTERWATPRAAATAGVHHALVFVRESWDSQLVVRMWALGVSHGDAEQLYAHADGCRLELALDSLEHAPLRWPADSGRIAASLSTLLRDSSLVHREEVAPGLSVHMQQGYVPAPICLDRVREMAQGVTPLAPFLLLQDGNVYVRDLHERDTVMLAAYPDRPVYLLHSDGVAPDAAPRFYSVRRDSIWGRGLAARVDSAPIPAEGQSERGAR
jgi:hypothetical protein